MVCLRDVLREYEEDCPDDFAGCEVIFESSWSDYEEAAWVVVFDFLGELYEIGYYDCVMCLDDKFAFLPVQINEFELEELKKEWRRRS